MPNFGLDQRKPERKNKSYSSKTDSWKYKKPNSIIIIGFILFSLFKIFDSKYSVSSKVIF
jgi:hypothetical protein